MSLTRKLHFTGIGSPVMFDLAVAMKKAGHQVSGSDATSPDDIANARLAQQGLSPDGTWHPESIVSGLDAVIIAPGVPKDNQELQRALILKIPVLSYPEFIQQECRNKHRVVVTGSHGKTMIAIMILHVLKFHKRSVDYVLSRPVPGMTDSVQISEAPVVILEGQDGLASTLDATPIFLKYKHHVGIISGIEWFSSQHYSSKEEYNRQFSLFEKATPKGGVLIYFDLEPVIGVLGKEPQPDVLYIPYKMHASQVVNGQEYLVESSSEKHPVKLSGKVNSQNISAAKETVKKLGITTPMFYEAIQTFGAESI